MAASSGYDPRTNSGIADAFEFVFFSSDEYIAEGTYTIPLEFPPPEEPYNTAGGIRINFDHGSETGESYGAESGTATVSISDKIYTVEFDVILENLETATGSYTGSVWIFKN